jgi:hypothetical protein
MKTCARNHARRQRRARRSAVDWCLGVLAAALLAIAVVGCEPCDCAPPGVDARVEPAAEPAVEPAPCDWTGDSWRDPNGDLCDPATGGDR